MELLCIKTHSQGLVKVGNVYPCFGESKCICGVKQVNVGIKSKSGKTRCFVCDSLVPNNGIGWIMKSLFVEIGEQDESETYKQEELIKIEL